MPSPCDATTARGRPCRNLAVRDGLCRVHQQTTLTAEVADQIVNLLGAGNHDDVAAMAAGATPAALQLWLNRDPGFRARADEARAKGEATHVTRIARAAQTDWKASAWFLERAHPERWARPQPRILDEPGEPGEQPGLDALDELASKRDQRRAGLA